MGVDGGVRWISACGRAGHMHASENIMEKAGPGCGCALLGLRDCKAGVAQAISCAAEYWWRTMMRSRFLFSAVLLAPLLLATACQRAAPVTTETSPQTAAAES